MRRESGLRILANLWRAMVSERNVEIITTGNDPGGGDLIHVGMLDMHGQPASRKSSGGWRAAMFILMVQILTNTAFYGIANNLIMYLTTVMHDGNASAAKNVNNWNGTGYVTPFIAAFIADAFWGRYWTAVASCLIYMMGSVLLTVSASVPSLRPLQCPSKDVNCHQSSQIQASFLYVGLYLMSLGAGGVYSTITALGGDQFDEDNDSERKQKSSFFNWFYQCIFMGSLVASTFSVYIQDNVSWGWGWSISNGALILGTCILFLGSPRYRYHKPMGNPIVQAFATAFRKLRVAMAERECPHEVGEGGLIIEGSHRLQQSALCVDKAAIITEKAKDNESVRKDGQLRTMTQSEEVKFVIRVFPIWLTSILYSTVYSQMATLFIMQGATMKLDMGSIRIPPASLSVFESSSVILWVVIYDRILVPFLQRHTGNPRGISGLQRIGIGLALSIVAMIIAVIVEVHRLRLARDHNRLDDNHTAVPMTVFWEIPQYIVMGASEVFTYIGLLEFFYDQAPHAIRSVGSALSMLAVALGNFFSSCLVSIVNRIAKRSKGGHGPVWIADNLNSGRIDLFYTLLTVLSLINLVAFIIFAKRHRDTAKTQDEKDLVSSALEGGSKDLEIAINVKGLEFRLPGPTAMPN